MFPVKPSQTTTSAACASSSRLSTLPTKSQIGCPSSSRMRLADEPVPLLRLLADREKGDVRVGDAQDLLGEDGAHVRELERGAPAERRRSRPRRSAPRARRWTGSGTAIAGRWTSGQPADLEEPGGEHRARVPGGDDGVCASPSPTARQAAKIELSRFSRAASEGFSSIATTVVGVDDLEALGERLEHVAPAEQDGLDARPRPPRARPRRSPPAPDRRPSRRRRPGSWSSARAPGSRAARPHDRGRCRRSGRRGEAASADGTAGTRRRGRRELVRRAPLVAARLRGFSLGDCHAAGQYS